MSITTRKTVKDEYLIVVDDSIADKHYFETSADQTIIDTPIAGVTGSNVAEALKNLATDISNAGDVKDVKNADGTSIVDANGVAQMKDAVVKAASKVTSNLYVDGYNLDNTTKAELTFNGGEDKKLTLTKGDFALNYASGVGTVRLANSGAVAGTYNGITVDSKGRVTNAVDGDYATNTDVNGKLDKKLDKAGGTVTGDLVVQGNLAIKGTTTTVDTQTLEVKDNLIVVAKDNTTALTTPAGMYVPKYDGANNVALVVDNDGMAKVGKAVLDSSGNIDKSNSELQTLATRTGLADGNIVKYDGTNKTLVDTGKKVGDFATAAQGANADSALTKANANATEIANIKNGDTTVPKASHAKTADTATKATSADSATHATSADSATTATTANKLNKALHFGYYNKSTSKSEDSFDGSAEKSLMFEDGNFSRTKVAGSSVVPSEYRIDLKDTGVTAGVYTAVQVDAKGRATVGNRAFAVIGATDDIPSDVMVGGFILRAKA